MDKITRIQELVKELNQYRNEYYNINKPSVSDVTYDNLFDELNTLEQNTHYILANSPTQTVGYTVLSKLQKRTHPTALKSLDKTKSLDELNKWRNSRDVILMLKGDGLTVELDYEDGRFIGGYTRGNGEIGEDISHNCRAFKNIPLTIPFEGKLRVSGEAIIHWNDFEKTNSSLSEEEKYATPRNLVSGSVRQLDSKICADRNVYFYAFNILEAIDTETSVDVLDDSKYENFKWLAELGFWTIVNTKICQNISEADIHMMKEVAQTQNIPIDGIVASFNSIEYSNLLGTTAHHPLHSLAFKFTDETEESVLRSVEWNTTRSGQINPTACFDTVILDNTEVSRASLFNLDFIRNLKLNISSRIKVSKRNLIIPYIEENLDADNGILEFPEVCPSCGKEAVIKNTGTADYLFCTNDNCPAKMLDKFVHLIERDALNIEGMSEATLETFINKGWIKTFVDIYRIEKYKSDIIKTEGFGIRSYEKLIEAIEKSKNTKFEQFVYALGIPQIGKGGAKRLAKHFKNDINAFLEATSSHHNFTGIEDFGLTTAYSIFEYFENLENMSVVKDLLQYIIVAKPEEKKIVADNPFKGAKVYATGKFANYKKDEIKTLLESLGAEFASGYAKSLNYLIEGSLEGSSKVEKARKDGVPVLSEVEFMKIIGREV